MTLASLVGMLAVGRINTLDGAVAPGVSDGQASLACCHPGGHRESEKQLSTRTELTDWMLLRLLRMGQIMGLCFQDEPLGSWQEGEEHDEGPPDLTGKRKC